MKQKEREEQEAKEQLLKLLQPGDTVLTSLKHVSRSGMYRVINLFVVKDNELIRLDRWASILLQGYDQRHGGCKAGGCGMDMGFHLVYSLSYRLFRDGFMCTGEKCQANDHFNGDRDYTPHMHTDPGYALKQRWM